MDSQVAGRVSEAEGLRSEALHPAFFTGRLTDEAQTGQGRLLDVCGAASFAAVFRRAGRLVRPDNLEYLVHLNHEKP